MKARSLVLCFGMLVVSGASGCSFSVGSDGSGLDIPGLERAITKTVEGGTDYSVSNVICPDKVSVTKGVRFDCQVLLEGRTLPYEVEITSDGGDVSYEPKAALIITEKAKNLAERWIKEQTGIDATANCGTEEFTIINPGNHFYCSASAGNRISQLEVTVKDVEGHVEFAIADK